MPRSHSALRITIRAHLATVGRKVEPVLNASCVHIARDEALPGQQHRRSQNLFD
jgi:hypothetical protein